MGFAMTAAIWAALLAGAAGASELAARYRDDPLRALRSWPAILYLALNAVTALAAAFLLVRFAPSQFAPSGRPDIVQIALTAGFGSLAVMRLSVVRLKVGADEISVGPALVIEQVLKVVDRGVDRHLAAHRATVADALADRIDFANQGMPLVVTCIALLQNASAEEQTRLIDVARGLAGRADLPARVKSISLILALLGVVGEKVLRAAVASVTPTPA